MYDNTRNNELHISIDFESLAAKATNPALLSAGVVTFDPNAIQSPASLAGNPSLHLKLSSRPGGQTAKYGRVIENDTLGWWSRQDGEAKVLLAECMNSDLDLRDALLQLNAWLEDQREASKDAAGNKPELHAWSYGAKSDLVWWATACEAAGVEYPIHYRNEHCLRTLAGELPFVACEAYGVKHSALDDAIAQAAWAQRLRGALRHGLSLADATQPGCSEPALGAVDPALLSPSVKAEAHDDAYVNEVEFDAAAWFAQADDSEITDLRDIEWRGDEPADRVALFFEDTNAEMKAMFTFCHATIRTARPIGFECSVDEDSAMAWLKQHRPGLWAIFVCDDEGIDLMQAEEPEIKGMWDWLGPNGNACEHSFDTLEDAALNAVAVLKLND